MQGYETKIYKDETFFIDESTGEYVPADICYIPKGSRIITPKQQEELKKKKMLLEEKRNNDEEKKIRRTITNKIGNFFFIMQNECFDGISPENVTRLIYLLTYLNYDGKLMLTERKQITKAHLEKLLNVSNSTVNRFLNETLQNYLSLNENGLSVNNQNIIFKGKIKRHLLYDKYQKFYIDSIRTLYKQVKTKNHNKLGYIFKLLPYIHVEYNLICQNPFEENFEDIKPLRFNEFCEIINYRVSNRYRLIRIYDSLKFDVGYGKQKFLSFVRYEDDYRMFVNPHILYCGINFECVKVLGLFNK